MATATRYHVNPEGLVKRCSAASEDTCKFTGAAHFTGTKDQAEFMQEMITAGGGMVAPAVAPATQGSDYINLPFRGDNLRATKEANGKYTISTAYNNTILAEDVDLVGGGDAAGLKRWAVQDSPYQANKIDHSDFPGVTDLRAVMHKNADGSLEHHGFIYKRDDLGEQTWVPVHQLFEVGSANPQGVPGYFTALSYTTKKNEAFHEAARQEQAEYSARALYEMARTDEVHEYSAARVIHRGLNWEDRVYHVDADTAKQIREKFYRTPDAEADGKGQLPDEEDQVYIHEVRDSINDARVESIKVIWGARSWSTRARTFFSGGGESAETGLANWLREDAA